jgi:hypothetical protein
VFACEGRTIAIRILDSIAKGVEAISEVRPYLGRPLTRVEERKVRTTEARLCEIVETEGNEIAAWRARHASVDDNID